MIFRIPEKREYNNFLSNQTHERYCRGRWSLKWKLQEGEAAPFFQSSSFTEHIWTDGHRVEDGEKDPTSVLYHLLLGRENTDLAPEYHPSIHFFKPVMEWAYPS